MLAVNPANFSIATQEILGMTEAYPDGQKALSEPATEQHVIKRNFVIQSRYHNPEKDKVEMPWLKIRLQNSLSLTLVKSFQSKRSLIDRASSKMSTSLRSNQS